MRVLRIIARLNVGGPAIQVTELNHDVPWETALVYGSLHAGEELMFSQVPGKSFFIPELQRPISPKNDFGAFCKLRKIIKDYQPNIIHTHTAKAGLLGRLAGLTTNRNIQLYHTFHGNVFDGYFANWKTKLFIGLERWLAKRTTKLIAISEQQKQQLLDHKIGKEQNIEKVSLGTTPCSIPSCTRVPSVPLPIFCLVLK